MNLQMVRFCATALIGVAVLAGCGPMPAATPTAEPTAPPPAATAADVPSTPASPAASPATLGDLAAAVNAAWPGVRSYRITFTGAPLTTPLASASPVASSAATPQATPVAGGGAARVSIRELASNGAQRQTVSGLGGDDHEAILSGDSIFIRGPLVAQLVSGAAPETWLQIEAASAPAGSRLAFLLGGLPASPPSPLAGVPERLWPQTLRGLGSTSFDGRECQSFAAADTITQTGTRVDFVIAVDPTGLPCFIETSSGGIVQGREEYTEINKDLTIIAPTDATPVAAIPPALATPAAHD